MNSSDAAAAAAAAAQAAQIAAVKSFDIEAFTLLALALSATILRTYSRISHVGIRHLQADDYLVWLGVTFYAIETGLAYCVGEVAHGLANNDMTPAQRASLDPSSMEYQLRVIGSKIQISGWTSYSALLWSLKASMCAFFLRLTDGLDGYRMRIYIGFGLIVASWLTVILTLYLSCRPLYKMWQIFPDPGIYCQPAISPALLWTFLSMNVSTDLYLISIPLPMLFRATMPKMQKVALMALFCCGLFVTMAAILRVVFIVTDLENGALLAGSWAVRETFVAVITTNLPMLFPLFKRWMSPIVSIVGSSLGKDSSKGSSKLPTLETFGQKAVRRKPPRSANPIPNVTFTESEERMMEMNNIDLEGGKAGIQKQLEISVSAETHADAETARKKRGNYTTTSPHGAGPERTSYFADHIYSDRYNRQA